MGFPRSVIPVMDTARSRRFLVPAPRGEGAERGTTGAALIQMGDWHSED
jgi:hypothetical protein